MTDSPTAHRRRVPKARVFLVAALAAGCIAAAIPAFNGSSPALAATPSCTPAAAWPGTNASFAQQVVGLVNQHRLSLGLFALSVNATLTDAAVWKSRHMAAYGYFAHSDPAPPVARDAITRMLDCGYASGGWIGENIASGQQTPSAVVTAWLSSPEHRANIESSAFRSTGVGVAVGGPSGFYWTQEFAGGSGTGTPPPAPPSAPPGTPPAPGSPPPPPATPPPPPSPPSPPAQPGEPPDLPPERDRPRRTSIHRPRRRTTRRSGQPSPHRPRSWRGRRLPRARRPRKQVRRRRRRRRRQRRQRPRRLRRLRGRQRPRRPQERPRSRPGSRPRKRRSTRRSASTGA